MSTFLVSYATERFAAVQEELHLSAERWGVTPKFAFNEKDLLGTQFYNENREILDAACGAGYWAWKPYFILRALESMAEGDILFYCDAGSKFIDSPAPLVRLCQESEEGVILFDARPLRNRAFTKRDCFIVLGCDSEKHWDAYKVIATILVLRKCPAAVALMQEWLSFCCQRTAVSDDPDCLGTALPGFLQHRWDQAILSVLASKYELETYRNPTVWGNFLKLPAFRVEGELITSPYGLAPFIDSYSATPQANSPYGTIFEINRLPNYEGKSPLPASAFASSSSDKKQPGGVSKFWGGWWKRGSGQ